MQRQAETMDADDLTKADQAILDVLKRGRGGDDPWGLGTKGFLVDETNFSRNSIYNRLEILEAHGHVELVHGPTRLFAFVNDPRDTDC